MTIQERYTSSLEAEKWRITKIDDTERIRRSEELSQRYRLELPAETLKQAQLIEELKQLGVWQLIEEFTGEHLEIRQDNGRVIHDVNRPWEDAFIEGSDKIDAFNPGMIWTFDVLSPYLQGGIWNSDLRVTIEHIDLACYPMFSRGDGVMISYSQDKTFTVEGKTVTYKGHLPNDLDVRKALVEESIASALVNPYLNGLIPRS